VIGLISEGFFKEQTGSFPDDFQKQAGIYIDPNQYLGRVGKLKS